MVLLGNRMRALIGLWVLAGLVVLGVNGFMLMALLDEPLVGYSNAARNADQAFRQYRKLLNAESEKITSGMELLANRFNPIVVEEEQPVVRHVPDPRPEAKRVTSAPVVLPELTGILTSRSSDGTTRRLALIDGGVRAEGDRIRDLTVKRVGNRGVSLVRGDQSWFLKAPEIGYTVSTQ